MTNDDVRRIAAEVKRELHGDVRIVIDGLHRLEEQFRGLRADVLHLQNDKIVREAREDERERATKAAAELVATKAAKAISDRERSRKWWLGFASAVTAAIVAVTTLTSVLGQYLHNAH